MITLTTRLNKLEKHQNSLPIYFNFIDINGKPRKMNLNELHDTVFSHIIEWQAMGKKHKYARAEKIIIPLGECDNIIQQLEKNRKNEKAYRKLTECIILNLKFIRDGYLIIPKNSGYEIFFITGEKLLFDSENNFIHYEN